jgi:hypothetical protein
MLGINKNISTITLVIAQAKSLQPQEAPVVPTEFGPSIIWAKAEFDAIEIFKKLFTTCDSE